MLKGNWKVQDVSRMKSSVVIGRELRGPVGLGVELF